MKTTTTTFAQSAAKSRKHKAYWKALAELEYGEVREERNWLKEWLFYWLSKTDGCGLYVTTREITAALAGSKPPKRRRP